MTNFTQSEKIAIADVLIQIMNADSNIDDEEVAYLNQLRLLLGISKDDLSKAKSQDIMESLRIIKNMNTPNKLAVALMLIEMMRADGNMAPEELKTFALIARIVEFPNINKL